MEIKLGNKTYNIYEQDLKNAVRDYQIETYGKVKFDNLPSQEEAQEFVDKYFIMQISNIDDFVRLVSDELSSRLQPFDDIQRPEAREYARNSFIKDFLSYNTNHFFGTDDLYETTFEDYIKSLKIIMLEEVNTEHFFYFYLDFQEEYYFDDFEFLTLEEIFYSESMRTRTYPLETIRTKVSHEFNK